MYESGRILRVSGGLCWVLPNGEEETLPCVARGNVKRREEGVAVGDRVRISREGDAGVVEDVLPRRTYLIRPNVANVDQAIVVVAATQPDPNPYFLDRFLVLVERARLDAVICINKVDLAEPESLGWLLELYSRIGYKAIHTSARTGKGIEALAALLAGKTSVFAGPSGVGKSALLNMVQPGHDLAEGELSAKIRRGKHTTREVMLIPLGAGGFVADTPGFSSLDITDITPRELTQAFPEFAQLTLECRFVGCLHDREPDCAVKDGVDSGMVDAGRYSHYLRFLEELREAEKRQYK
ncbi:MAG: ribosome small subunit-dependent GTPase A [Firmicutes bacterium]|jgi:ribosome biogenesis GTPase|nr:ribosome small subunit-dependent GTPase A [Bacillota bacterium]MDD4336902.1 ribosome small subunit-dependent GTPase A [Bacillota bacterium]